MRADYPNFSLHIIPGPNQMFYIKEVVHPSNYVRLDHLSINDPKLFENI